MVYTTYFSQLPAIMTWSKKISVYASKSPKRQVSVRVMIQPTVSANRPERPAAIKAVGSPVETVQIWLACNENCNATALMIFLLR